MKKIAIILAIIMSVTNVNTAWAQSKQLKNDRATSSVDELNQDLTLTEAIKIMEEQSFLKDYSEEIFEDVDNFDDMSFTSCGDIVEIDYSDNQLVYSVDYGTVKDEIQVLSRTDDYSEYQVVEGDKSDIILYFNDGSILVNDALYEKQADYYMHADDYSDWWQTQCPYGVTSDYTYKIGTKNNPDVENTKYWNNLTFTAFSIALTGAVSYLVAPLGGAICHTVSSLYALLGYDSTPYTKHMSFKLVKYYHKNKTNGVVKGTLRATRFKITGYTKANYQGKSQTYNEFYCKEKY